MNVLKKLKLEPLALRLANLSGIQTGSRVTQMNRENPCYKEESIEEKLHVIRLLQYSLINTTLLEEHT